jgi:hypothetical protein
MPAFRSNYQKNSIATPGARHTTKKKLYELSLMLPTAAASPQNTKLNFS